MHRRGSVALSHTHTSLPPPPHTWYTLCSMLLTGRNCSFTRAPAPRLPRLTPAAGAPAGGEGGAVHGGKAGGRAQPQHTQHTCACARVSCADWRSLAPAGSCGGTPPRAPPLPPPPGAHRPGADAGLERRLWMQRLGSQWCAALWGVQWGGRKKRGVLKEVVGRRRTLPRSTRDSHTRPPPVRLGSRRRRATPRRRPSSTARASRWLSAVNCPPCRAPTASAASAAHTGFLCVSWGGPSFVGFFGGGGRGRAVARGEGGPGATRHPPTRHPMAHTCSQARACTPPPALTYSRTLAGGRPLTRSHKSELAAGAPPRLAVACREGRAGRSRERAPRAARRQRTRRPAHNGPPSPTPTPAHAHP